MATLEELEARVLELEGRLEALEETAVNVDRQIDQKIAQHEQNRHATVEGESGSSGGAAAGGGTRGAGAAAGPREEGSHEEFHPATFGYEESVRDHMAAEERAIQRQYGMGAAPNPPTPPHPGPGGASIPALPSLGGSRVPGGYPSMPSPGSQPGFTLGTGANMYMWIGADLSEVVVANRRNIVGGLSVTHINGTRLTRVGGDVTNNYFANLTETIDGSWNSTVKVDLHETVIGEVHRTEGPFAYHTQKGIFIHHVSGASVSSYFGFKIYNYMVSVHHQITGMESIYILGAKVERILGVFAEHAPAAKHFHDAFLLRVTGISSLVHAVCESKANIYDLDAKNTKFKATYLSQVADEVTTDADGSVTIKSNAETRLKGAKLKQEADDLEAKAGKFRHIAGKFELADGAVKGHG